MATAQRAATGLMERYTGLSRARILEMIYGKVEIIAGQPRFKPSLVSTRSSLGSTRVPVNIDALEDHDRIMRAARARKVTPTPYYDENDGRHPADWE